MKNGTAEVVEQDDEDQISMEDAYLAVEVLKKALEERHFYREAIIGKKYLDMSKENQQRENLTKRACFHFLDEEKKLPILFYRFVGDESPIAETFFYPFEAILFFLQEARQIVEIQNSNLTAEERNEIIFRYTLEMTLLLIDNFYRRIELLMDFISIEIVGQWHRNKIRDVQHFHLSQGNKAPKQNDQLLDLTINRYRKELIQFWKYQGQSRDNWRKLTLAEQYDILMPHWNFISKASNDENMDWRTYAKAGQFEDTPDDLLKKLGNSERMDAAATKLRISELALEHAARRAGFIKMKSVSDYARNKRKEGVQVSDYSSQLLFSYLKEGRDLKQKIKETEIIAAQVETELNFEQVSDVALEKKRKHSERKYKFILDKTEKQLEQKAKSAQKEIS